MKAKVVMGNRRSDFTSQWREVRGILAGRPKSRRVPFNSIPCQIYGPSRSLDKLVVKQMGQLISFPISHTCHPEQEHKRSLYSIYHHQVNEQSSKLNSMR